MFIYRQKQNEYQAIAAPTSDQQQQQANKVPSMAPNNSLLPNSGTLATATASGNYREQGEQIRQDIVRRAGQLQQVLSSSMDVIKDKGDVIVKRLLEQLNSRLDLAKSKADKIINEVNITIDAINDNLIQSNLI